MHENLTEASTTRNNIVFISAEILIKNRNQQPLQLVDMLWPLVLSFFILPPFGKEH